ncbi:MAG: DUF1836 domain-containing protein, partial [Clostridiales bacterium]
MKEILEKAVNEVKVNSEFRTKEIPEIDLYMDQIIGFINDNFADDGDEKEKILTKTMIHNYSKEGLIKPVKGKKYSKEQIIQMLLIYQLKNTLKISDIKAALQEIYSWENYNGNFLAACYDKHMECKSIIVEDSQELLGLLINEGSIDLDKKEDV